MMYEMENGQMSKNPRFDKSYAAELLGADLLPEKPPEVGFSHTDSRLSVNARREERARVIAPEDLVQIHIDVERFFNLFKLFGLKDRNGFLREWTKVYVAIVPKDAQHAETVEERFLEMTGQSATIGMNVSDVDAELVRRSIVANLSRTFQEVSGMQGGASIVHGRTVKPTMDDE